DRAHQSHAGKAAPNTPRGQRVDFVRTSSHPLAHMSGNVSNALRRFAPALILVGLTSVARAQAAPAVSVIPYPASVSVDKAVHFTFGPTTSIALSAPSNDELRALGDLAASILRDELGARARVVSAPANATP